jgi:hypothetical protein
MPGAFADRFTADARVKPAGYVQYTDLSSATKGVATSSGRVALVQALDQNVRYRDDGQDPTTTVGVRIHAGESIWYTGDLGNLRIIEETSGAEVNILTYE